MYSALKDRVERRTEKDIEEMNVRLQTMTCKEAKGTYYVKQLMTSVAKDLISRANDNDKIPAIALSKMMARYARLQRRRMSDDLEKIETVGMSEAPKRITVAVEWHRGHNGECNPTATVIASEPGVSSTYGRATGCGYDKESAAVARALNQNYAVLRLWYDIAEIGGKFEYSVSYSDSSPLPVMDGGCGMSATIRVFDALGYDTLQRHGKTFDYYEFCKR